MNLIADPSGGVPKGQWHQIREFHLIIYQINMNSALFFHAGSFFRAGMKKRFHMFRAARGWRNTETLAETLWRHTESYGSPKILVNLAKKAM